MNITVKHREPELLTPKEGDAIKLPGYFRVIAVDGDRVHLQTTTSEPVVDFWLPRESAEVVGVFVPTQPEVGI